MSRLTPIDEAASRRPLLVRPFQAGMTGWIVVFGATVVVLAGGAITSQISLAASLPVLVIPVVVCFGFGIVQWWQVRSAGASTSRLLVAPLIRAASWACESEGDQTRSVR